MHKVRQRLFVGLYAIEQLKSQLVTSSTGYEEVHHLPMESVDTAATTQSVGAVSYTHLDVYKRQLICNMDFSKYLKVTLFSK